ncbi:hypothetical protein PRZ48_008710 [Zasmidium cellare]|uniref:Uncharacterized protein n=1 Tax=Zasmidium cellare TaxID=395010 RepID=A0ABR0EG80_ZASCE|nr:hypothetical protein PRZ48_008710 [Zasmidium cellare]
MTAMMEYWNEWSQGSHIAHHQAKSATAAVEDIAEPADTITSPTPAIEDGSYSVEDLDAVNPQTDQPKRKKPRHTALGIKKPKTRTKPRSEGSYSRGFDHWLLKAVPIAIRDPRIQEWIDDALQKIRQDERPLPGGGPVKRYFWRQQNEAKIREMLDRKDFGDDIDLNTLSQPQMVSKLVDCCRKAGLLWSDLLSSWQVLSHDHKTSLHQLLLDKAPDVADRANIFAGHATAIDDSVLPTVTKDGRKVRRVIVVFCRDSGETHETAVIDQKNRRAAESLVIADRFAYPYPAGTFEDHVITVQRINHEAIDPLSISASSPTRDDSRWNAELRDLHNQFPNDHIKIFGILRGPEGLTATERFFQPWVEEYIDPATLGYEFELYVYQGQVRSAVMNDTFFQQHMGWSGIMNGAFSLAPIPVRHGEPQTPAHAALFKLNTMLDPEQ